MVLIIYYAYKQIPAEKTLTHHLLLIGLFFSMIGDGTIHWFIIGLSAFLIGHLFYISGFTRHIAFTWSRFSILIPLLLFSIFIGNRLVTNLILADDKMLIIPVIAYIIVIAIMSLFATMTGNYWAAIGSIFFVISDSILAWNKFIAPIGYSGLWIMTTYYSAQFFIAHSFKTIGEKN